MCTVSTCIIIWKYWRVCVCVKKKSVQQYSSAPYYALVQKPRFVSRGGLGDTIIILSLCVFATVFVWSRSWSVCRIYTYMLTAYKSNNNLLYVYHIIVCVAVSWWTRRLPLFEQLAPGSSRRCHSIGHREIAANLYYTAYSYCYYFSFKPFLHSFSV